MMPLQPDLLGRFWLATIVHLWQTTLVLAPVWLVARVMRRAPAQALHGLWTFAALKLLLPLAILVPAARWSLESILPGMIGLHRVSLRPVLAVLDPVRALAGPGAAHVDRMSVFFAALTAAWLAVAAWRVILLVRAHATAARLPVQRVDAAPEDVRDRLRRALDVAAIDEERVRSSGHDGLPRVSGILRPRIVVPESVARRLPIHELTAVLLHEEGHRRRRDPARLALLQAASAVFFFYPPWAILRRRLEETAELICDEGVLRFGVNRETYARALARAIHFASVPVLQPSAAGAHGESFLRARFERIITQGRFTMKSRDRWLIAAAFVPLALCIAVPALTTAADRTAPAAGSGSGAQPAPEVIDADQGPEIVKTVQPVYPEAERKAGVEGKVVVRAYIDLKGAVQQAEAVTEVENHPAFTKSALEAVRQWVFKPAEAKGKPVAIWIQVPIQFRLH